MTLQEAKDKIAIKYGFKDWSDYVAFMINTKVKIYKVILAMDEVAELYCNEK